MTPDSMGRRLGASRPQAGGVRRPAFTLVELIVALVLLGILAGIAGVEAMGSQQLPPTATRRDSVRATIVDLRRRAVIDGRTLGIVLDWDSTGGHMVTAFPDGRVAGAASLGLDPLAGAMPGALR